MKYNSLNRPSLLVSNAGSRRVLREKLIEGGVPKHAIPAVQKLVEDAARVGTLNKRGYAVHEVTPTMVKLSVGALDWRWIVCDAQGVWSVNDKWED